MTDLNSSSSAPLGNFVSDLTLIYDDRIVYVEGEGDYTVRPIPPERLAQAIAERDLIAKCLAEQNAKRDSSEP